MARRAQVSIEYLLITAFAFMLSIPLIALFYSQSHELNEDVTSSQADRIASEIVDAANEVYYLGPPSKKTLTVYMPDRVESVEMNGETLIFNVKSRAGDYEVVKVAATNISGNVKPHSGIHKIEVKATSNDVEING